MTFNYPYDEEFDWMHEAELDYEAAQEYTRSRYGTKEPNNRLSRYEWCTEKISFHNHLYSLHIMSTPDFIIRQCVACDQWVMNDRVQ